ncbi:MAG: porin [Pseudomonadota bacterium]
MIVYPLRWCAALVCALLAAPTHAVEVKIYGKIHVSGDVVDSGHASGMHTAISSNSSQIGFTGSELLTEWLMAVWRLESDIDVTGERGWLLQRNRYIGLASVGGTFMAGYQDTPFRLAAQRFDIYGETLVDYRTVFGHATNTPSDVNTRISLDTRARNSIMYQSPKWGNFQMRLMQSAGEDKSEDGGDANYISSASFSYQPERVSLSLAFETQQKYSSNAARLAGGVQIGVMRLNAMYEILESAFTEGEQRQAFGGNITIGLPGNFSINAEGVGVINYRGTKLSAALAVIGLGYQPARSTQIYLLATQIINDQESNYMFGATGHEDQYKLAKLGQDPFAVSLGITHKF